MRIHYLLSSTILSFIVITVATTVDITARAAFSDVDSAHPNAEAIKSLEDDGIIEGYEDGTFLPDVFISRAEFTKIIMSTAFDDAEAYCLPTTAEFPDVPENAWFMEFVCAARTLNVIHGYPNGRFRPDQPINVAEAGKILARSFRLNGADHGYTIWYEGGLRALADVHALPLTLDHPSSLLTRGEMVEIVYRLKEGITHKPSLTYEELIGIRVTCPGGYEPGDTFPSSDGCNTCFCGDNGSIGCTKRACLFDASSSGEDLCEAMSCPTGCKDGRCMPTAAE